MSAGDFEKYSKAELLGQLRIWNAELARNRIDPVLTDEAAINMPLYNLRIIVARTADRISEAAGLGPLP